MLLASRTDTLWFSEYAAKGEVRLIQSRLRFGNAKNNVPFPSVVIIFNGNTKCNKSKAKTYSKIKLVKADSND